MPPFAVNRSGTRVGQRGATDRGRFEFDDRVWSVLRAVFAARKYVPERFAEATGYELKEIASGIVPGLLMMLAIIALSTTVGAAAGAALGALAGGVGAIPGAAAGAALGFNVSLAILNFLGLAFLAVYIGEALLDGIRVAGEAAQMAWNAIDHRGGEDLAVESAAAHLAYAGALVFRGVLQGIVAFLLARGTAAAASRVPELVAQLRASKLGAGFAEWVSKNWQGLLTNPKLKPPSAKTSNQPATGAATSPAPQASGSEAPTSRPPARPVEKPAPPPAESKADALARQMFERAQKAEKATTQSIKDAAQQQGGRLTGLENVLKTKESLANKIVRDTKTGLTPEQAASGIGDSLRYTVVLESERYAAGTNSVLSALEAKGYKVAKVKNTWKEGAPYKGVNTQLQSPSGEMIEVQFHTPQSYAMKQSTHGLYEQARTPGISAEQEAAINKAMQTESAKLATPPNVGTIRGR
jgi:hypothetical protein